MRRLLFLLLLLTPLALVWGCKKGGPAQPYDVKLPNTAGNLIVAVRDNNGAGVTNVGVKITDYLGQVFNGTTDFTGTTAFNFDYAKYYVENPNPSFTVEIPTQGRYNDSLCSLVPKNGQNSFVFTASPSLSVVVPPSAPTSYSYNVTNNLVCNVNYDNGGNLQVPISIAAQNVPSGWTVNYNNQILGGSVTQGSVTFVIPTSEYRQPPVSIVGFYANDSTPSLYVWSPAFNITRGFPVSVCCHVSLTFGQSNPFQNGQPFIALTSSSFSFSTVNGGNIPIQARFQVSGYVNGGTANWMTVEDYWTTGNGSGTNTYAQGNTSGPKMSLNTGLAVRVDIVPPAGLGLNQCTFTKTDGFPTGGSATGSYTYSYDLPCQLSSN